MNWLDVTRPLAPGMLVYPGDVQPIFSQKDAGNYLISDLHLSSHTGTHIDAPVHYLKTGDTIDTIPLQNLIGTCNVIDLGRVNGLITKKHLLDKLEGNKRILLKTSFSGKNTFIEDYPSLSLDAAEYLISWGVSCVGIDSPSIESFECDGSVHRCLLGCNCIIIELLDLSGVSEGAYEMIALPLRLTGLDGSPARVILKKIR
ncbi:MAG: cyclase [Methanomicrobiales archaeon HGW-Methanomicrobiales-3]|jgi:arylformamidase|nr:MAG: cyclase [Methanomicrobiales archaeon HGW-Methanomicrobiales-3]